MYVTAGVYCRQTVNSLLKRLGLGQFFQAYVTAEDGMDTISQRFLSASIKLGRPPNQCVVFESSPAGITAAHNCTMKVWSSLHSCLRFCLCKQGQCITAFSNSGVVLAQCCCMAAQATFSMCCMPVPSNSYEMRPFEVTG